MIVCFMGLGAFFCLFEIFCCVVSFLLVVVMKYGFVLRGFSVLIGLFLCPCWVGCLLVVVYLSFVVCFVLILSVLCVFGFMFVFLVLEVCVLGIVVYVFFFVLILGILFKARPGGRACFRLFFFVFCVWYFMFLFWWCWVVLLVFAFRMRILWIVYVLRFLCKYVVLVKCRLFFVSLWNLLGLFCFDFGMLLLVCVGVLWSIFSLGLLVSWCVCVSFGSFGYLFFCCWGLRVLICWLLCMSFLRGISLILVLFLLLLLLLLFVLCVIVLVLKPPHIISIKYCGYASG